MEPKFYWPSKRGDCAFMGGMRYDTAEARLVWKVSKPPSWVVLISSRVKKTMDGPPYLGWNRWVQVSVWKAKGGAR
jgi:hypothetical protein